MVVKFITEETEVKYNSIEELSYFDDDNAYVALYINNEWEGDITVWKDSEMNDREYIIINYEIIYLDTLKKF
jgi:hypothetical protein